MQVSSSEKTSVNGVPIPRATLGGVIAGAGRAGRNEFLEAYDLGIPFDVATTGNEDVLILYASSQSMPNRRALNQVADGSNASTIGLYTVEDATSNCNVMKIIVTEPAKEGSKGQQCIAIVGQDMESYHVHKFMRTLSDAQATAAMSATKDGKKRAFNALNNSLPLRLVSRHRQTNGGEADIPTRLEMERYISTFKSYSARLPITLQKLKTLASKITGSNSSDVAIVAMVCNWGQAGLLFNFACNARSRGLDLSKVLLFATDTKTSELAELMGLHVFPVEDNMFGEIPERAAGMFGDGVFTSLMMAKLLSVHLLNQLKYHVLFQDVDVVWYRNPLEFFDDAVRRYPEVDVFFQDDGSRSEQFGPYFPNTGLYYVRYNRRTEYLFDTFARIGGDLILSSNSHQQALARLITEHASSTGLGVKVFGRDTALGMALPGGFHFHRRADYMKSILRSSNGKTVVSNMTISENDEVEYPSPYIFHMSWTKNKDNKRRYYQQMGEWFLRPQCEDKTALELKTQYFNHNSTTNVDRVDNDADIVNSCCSAAPLVSCHYRDKPSIVPCRESPPIDEGRPSFW